MAECLAGARQRHAHHFRGSAQFAPSRLQQGSSCGVAIAIAQGVDPASSTLTAAEAHGIVPSEAHGTPSVNADADADRDAGGNGFAGRVAFAGALLVWILPQPF